MNKLNVLYEDNHIIVVEKKPGILSQSDITQDEDLLTNVKMYIKEKYQKPGNVYIGLVHRLDRPVGGIMVFARTSKAAARLNKQITNHEMHKKYYAIVHGILSQKEDALVDKMDKIDRRKVILNDEKGKEAKLEYKVVGEKNNLSLLDINLITGRYHQIRLQFSSRGYPLLGDQLYGRDDEKQLALFAYELSFYHPVSKELMTFNLQPNGSCWDIFERLQ